MYTALNQYLVSVEEYIEKLYLSIIILSPLGEKRLMLNRILQQNKTSKNIGILQLWSQMKQNHGGFLFLELINLSNFMNFMTSYHYILSD